MFAWLRTRRRRNLLEQPFPPAWSSLLQKDVGHYPRLSAVQQAAVRDAVQILIAEKKWEGANGFRITDEVKVSIAAQAALLLLGDRHDYYIRVPSIIVYPTAFEVPDRDEFGDEDDTFPATVAAGQAVYRGPVLLAWDEVLAEGRDPSLGSNVVVHEFAHQLDYLDGIVNGTPPLNDAEAEARWGRVMQAAFDRHCDDLKARRETFFTEHAGENETEYFADASEAFFCVPHDLEAEEREVFALLLMYYGVDPRLWFPRR